MSSPHTYRSEIDGLRALAVVSVIINHFDPLVLPMGFLGVDVFFVISGYVITASLYERSADSFRQFLLEFYGRRIRRLAPALVLCVFVTGVATWLFVPQPKESFNTGIFALFGLSNLYLYVEGVDYFSPTRSLNTFLQTWSLGVEEQFYIIFPLIVWFAGFSFRTGKRAAFHAVMLVLSAVSLVLCAVYSTVDTEAAYYLTPMRIWELAAGALLFSSRLQSLNGLQPRAPLLACISFLGLLLAIAIPSPYHFLSLVGAVFFTTALIATTHQPGFIRTLLTHRWVIYVGLISYPLYLWHWPVISIGRWTIGHDVHWYPFQLAIMTGAAILTYEYIEKPVRAFRFASDSSRVIAYGVLACIACALIIGVGNKTGQVLGVQSAARSRSPQPLLPLRNGNAEYNNCVASAEGKFTPDKFDLCTIPPTHASGQTIWALGDSHAGHLQNLLYQLHDKRGLGVHLVETPGYSFPMLPAHQLAVRHVIFDEIDRRLKAGDIVLVSRLFMDRSRVSEPLGDIPEWVTHLKTLARRLAEKKVRLVVVGPPPIFSFDTPHACWFRSKGSSSCDILRSAISSRIAKVMEVLYASTGDSSNIYVFDSFSVLCPPTALTCSPLRDGTLSYRDKDHLNAFGAALLTDDFIGFLERNGLLGTAQRSG